MIIFEVRRVSEEVGREGRLQKICSEDCQMIKQWKVASGKWKVESDKWKVKIITDNKLIKSSKLKVIRGKPFIRSHP